MAQPPKREHDVARDSLTRESSAADALDQSVVAYEFWEQQVDASWSLLCEQRLMNTHQLRKGVESLEPAQYNALSYYERWAVSIARHCLHTGILTQVELAGSLGNPKAGGEQPRFEKGDTVRIRYENEPNRWLKPHLRTPGYLFGKEAVVQRYLGTFPNPEQLAYAAAGIQGPVGETEQSHLYRVQLRQRDVWSKYEGHPEDTLEAEIYEHWLLAADETPRVPPPQVCSIDEYIDPDEAHHRLHEKLHAHGHAHDHGGHDHVHEARVIVEKNAVDKEGEAKPAQHLAEALIAALITKGILDSAALQRRIESRQACAEQLLGARLVAKAWTDAQFKEELLQDGRRMMSFLGFDKLDNEMIVLENTPTVHNVLVCTLCSCYPRQLLGLPPGWYKSRSYRERVVKFPRDVLREFGVDVPVTKSVKVHDSNADMRYIIIPERPSGTEGWTEQQLISIVSRDSMIGVGVLSPQ